jgi:hypothetical protein
MCNSKRDCLSWSHVGALPEDGKEQVFVLILDGSVDWQSQQSIVPLFFGF